MTAKNDQFDPWQDFPTHPKMGGAPLPTHALDFVTIRDVTPLDAQIGISPKKTVPDALRDTIFAQPEPTTAEISPAGGDAADLPLMQTYALLDAAKIMHLAERLKASGLEHRCLYQGNAADYHGDVAPWLVRLEDGNAFTRSLFSAAEAPENLWWSDPGLLIRSRSGFDDLRNHLRKFTRLQDEQGKWFYFRFWEGWHFHVLTGRQEKLPELSRLFARITDDGEVITPHHRVEEAVVTRRVREHPSERLVLTASLRAEIKLAFFYRKMMNAAFGLHADHPDQARRYGEKPQHMWSLLFDFADEVRAADLRDPTLRARLMLLGFISFPEPWPAFIRQPFWQKIKATPGPADDQFEDFCSLLKYQNIRNGTAESIWW